MIGGRVGKYFYHVFIRSHLTLTGLVRWFMDYAARQEGPKTFPEFSHRQWHDFLWQVKNSLLKEFPELEFLQFKWNGEFYQCIGMRELGMYSWWKYHRNNGDCPRITAVGAMPGNLLLDNHPGLAERLMAVAQGIPGFIF